MPDILLKKVPSDVVKHILKRQYEAKTKKGISQYSLSTAVIQIIRKDMPEPKKSKKDD